MLPPLHTLPYHSKPSTQDYNRLVERLNILSKIDGRGGTQVITGPTGVHIRAAESTSLDLRTRLFEVQSSDTGYGKYNCYEQLIDGSDWENVANDVDLVLDKNTTTVEVMNAIENFIYTTYYEPLCVGDRILGWQTFDDDGTKRWCGIPVTGNMVRTVYTQEAAQSDEFISCKLLDYKADQVGAAFDVQGLVTDNNYGTNPHPCLNKCTPRIQNGATLQAINLWGWWYFTTWFQRGYTVRRAFVKTTPGAAATVACYLDVDATGEEVTVSCDIVNGSALNSAIPRITDGDAITVYYDNGGTWRCTTTFQTSEDCVCSS